MKKTSSGLSRKNTFSKFHWPRPERPLSKTTRNTTSNSSWNSPPSPSPRKTTPTTIQARLWMMMPMTHHNFPPLPAALPCSNPWFPLSQPPPRWSPSRSRGMSTLPKFQWRWIVKLPRASSCPKPTRLAQLTPQAAPPRIPSTNLSRSTRRTNRRTCLATP